MTILVCNEIYDNFARYNIYYIILSTGFYILHTSNALNL